MQLQTIGSAMLPTMWIRETRKKVCRKKTKKKERKLRSEEQSEAMKREEIFITFTFFIPDSFLSLSSITPLYPFNTLSL